MVGISVEPTFARFPAVLRPRSPLLIGLCNGKSRPARARGGRSWRPITVKSSLEAVPGVDKVVVSYEENTAVVTFDDAKTVVPALISATTNAGYPSSLKGRPRITDRSLITTGAIGPILAATCCATPLLKLPARASAERSATARWSPFGFA